MSSSMMTILSKNIHRLVFTHSEFLVTELGMKRRRMSEEFAREHSYAINDIRMYTRISFNDDMRYPDYVTENIAKLQQCRTLIVAYKLKKSKTSISKYIEKNILEEISYPFCKISSGKENDNSNVLLKKIENVFHNKRLHDITLVVGGVSYPAHRFMLCLSSDVFETMLMNSKWSDSHREVIELQEVQQCIEVFPYFLRYFYTGVISLSPINIIPLLVLADKYNVKDLTVLCVDYMGDHIADAGERGHLVIWFQYILSLNQPTTIDATYYCKIWQGTECMETKSPWSKILKACRNYIKWNLDACTKCFNTFKCDVLVGLLKQTDLVVHNEMQLFGYVASWLNYQSTKKLLKYKDASAKENYLRSLTEQVMSYIRYPMILPRQIAQLLMMPIVKQNKDFFVDKMAAAMEYNLIKQENQPSNEYVIDCTPRLYTCERWGNSFRVRTKGIKDYQSVKREIVTCSNLFDPERELQFNEESHWEIEMYLKGISFGKGLLSTSDEYIEIPEVIIDTVRATIKPKLQPEEIGKVTRHVRIAILVYAIQNKVVHVVTVVQKIMLFDSNQNLVVIDDLMKYDAVNQFPMDVPLVRVGDTNVSYFMSDRFPLKFHVIITPIITGLTDSYVGTKVQHVHF